jgi:hypothetical protein
MKFKAKFEKNSTERREITKYLFYDSMRGGQAKFVTDMSTTTPNQDRRTLLLKKAMMKRIENKMSLIKGLEKKQTMVDSRIAHRVVNKDHQGHVVKYLARRLL